MEIEADRIMTRAETEQLMRDMLLLLSPSRAELKMERSPTPSAAEPLPVPDAPADEDDASLAYWQKRKERALAERHELELARRRGEVCDIDETRRQLETCFGIIRERLLTIPGKLADALAGRTRDEVFAILADEIDATLTETSSPIRSSCPSRSSIDLGATFLPFNEPLILEALVVARHLVPSTRSSTSAGRGRSVTSLAIC